MAISTIHYHSNRLKIPKTTTLTALVLYNYTNCDPHVCLYLASKIEETHLKIENIFIAEPKHDNNKESHKEINKESNMEMNKESNKDLNNEKNFLLSKEINNELIKIDESCINVVKDECKIVEKIGFDFEIVHVHTYVIEMLKRLGKSFNVDGLDDLRSYSNSFEQSSKIINEDKNTEANNNSEKYEENVNVSDIEILKYFEKLDELYDSERVNLVKYFGKGKYDPKFVAFGVFSEEDIKKLEIDLFMDVDRALLNEMKKELNFI